MCVCVCTCVEKKRGKNSFFVPLTSSFLRVPLPLQVLDGEVPEVDELVLDVRVGPEQLQEGLGQDLHHVVPDVGPGGLHGGGGGGREEEGGREYKRCQRRREQKQRHPHQEQGC